MAKTNTEGVMKMEDNILRLDVDDYYDQVSGDRSWSDIHSKHTIMFESLLQDGFDWGRDDWNSYSIKPEYLEIIRPRINSKIEDRYRFRELGVLPPGRWKMNLKTILNKAADKQGVIYNRILDGLDLFSSTEDTVERTVLSEYPQAQLRSKDKDYASSAVENAKSFEKVRNQLDALEQYNRSFVEPDEAILQELEVCFSRYISFTL